MADAMEPCGTYGLMNGYGTITSHAMDSCFGLYIRCHSFSLALSALLAVPVMPELWPPSQRFVLGGFAEVGRKMSASARLSPLLGG